MKAEMLPAVIDPEGAMGRDADIGDAGGRQRPLCVGRVVLRAKSGTRILGELTATPCVSSCAWCEAHALELSQITPCWVGEYYDQLHASIPTKKQHLSALRCFFDRLVLRHAVGLNPAASVRGERY